MAKFVTDMRCRTYPYEIELGLTCEDETRSYSVDDAVQAHAVWMEANRQIVNGQFAETFHSGGKKERRSKRVSSISKSWLSFRGAFSASGRLEFARDEKLELLISLADHLADALEQDQVFITFDGELTVRSTDLSPRPAGS